MTAPLNSCLWWKGVDESLQRSRKCKELTIRKRGNRDLYIYLATERIPCCDAGEISK